MEIIDLDIFADKSIEEVISHADTLMAQGLESKINAHNILTSIVDLVPNDIENENVGAKGMLRHKIWKLEKFFGWNQHYSSQSGQDKFIFNCFFKNSFGNGFFVDIGAYDGVTGSNSLFFESKLGWDGIAVEPSNRQFKELNKNRNCECVNEAISNEKQTIEFIEVIDGYTQMSGLNKDFYTETFNEIENDPNSKIEKRIIETSIFSEIVPQGKVIDYLSIDIEGGELDLLSSIDFNIFDIKVLSLENNQTNEFNYSHFLKEKNFQFYDCIGVDEIYINRKYFSI